MGGTAAVLSRPRAVALAVLVTGLAVYGAVSERLPDVSSGADVAIVGLLVLPATLAAVWLGLPVAGMRGVALLCASAVALATVVVLLLLGLDSAANVAKLACFGLVGFGFLSLFEQLWWVVVVSVLVPWVDVWSVASGPSSYVLEERPGLFDRIAVELPTTGSGGDVGIGPPDVVFFALFLAAAARFALRVGWTWACMTGLLAVTLVLAWRWEALGLPALPAICLGFLLPNADRLWQGARSAWAGAHPGGEAD